MKLSTEKPNWIILFVFRPGLRGHLRTPQNGIIAFGSRVRYLSWVYAHHFLESELSGTFGIKDGVPFILGEGLETSLQVLFGLYTNNVRVRLFKGGWDVMYLDSLRYPSPSF